jgi:hypothetical protein
MQQFPCILNGNERGGSSRKAHISRSVCNVVPGGTNLGAD